jgi:hypothetical protein
MTVAPPHQVVDVDVHLQLLSKILKRAHLSVARSALLHSPLTRRLPMQARNNPPVAPFLHSPPPALRLTNLSASTCYGFSQGVLALPNPL